MRYFIKTFGCQQNKADSERIVSAFQSRGMKSARGYDDADYVVINTCMVRQSAENRVYGLVKNLGKLKQSSSRAKSRDRRMKIIVTGCIVGLAFRDKTGKYLKRLREVMPEVDEFMPIEEVGFDNQPVRQDSENAWVPISNGCNNFCTFCVVPFTRGREISRPYEDIITECFHLKIKGYKNITLLGQNVNSYGADLILPSSVIPNVVRDLATEGSAKNTYFEKSKIKSQKSTHSTSSGLRLRGRSDSRRLILSKVEGSKLSIKIKNLKFTKNFKFKNTNLRPVYVKHLGRYRIPTLFPYLLEDVAKMGFEKVDFISSNPWDFSNELIDVIARYKNITRSIHLPVQSGDDNVLRRMNRWYTSDEYFNLVLNLKSKILNLKITTDIIVGFCGETDEEFTNTVKLAKLVGFEKAYISMYSQRPMTAATKVFRDDVPHVVKKQRWLTLEKLINEKHINKKYHTIYATPAS